MKSSLNTGNLRLPIRAGRWCSVNKQKGKLKQILEKLYNKYNHRDLVKPDQLQFVYQYNLPSDMEIVALLAAAPVYRL